MSTWTEEQLTFWEIEKDHLKEAVRYEVSDSAVAKTYPGSISLGFDWLCGYLAARYPEICSEIVETIIIGEEDG